MAAQSTMVEQLEGSATPEISDACCNCSHIRQLPADTDYATLPCGKTWCGLCLNQHFSDTATWCRPGQCPQPICEAHEDPHEWHVILMDDAVCKLLTIESMRSVRKRQREFRVTCTSEEVLGQSCPICLELIAGREYVELACAHFLCVGCLDKTVSTSLRSRATWPPRYCDADEIREAYRSTISPALSKETYDLWLEKRKEYGARNPLYCPAADCGAYIAKSSCRVAVCPKTECGAGVCQMCKNLEDEHKYSRMGLPICPDDLGHENRTLIHNQGWQRCPESGCGGVVDKTEGCDHMICPACAMDFCYLCGKGLMAPFFQCPFGGGAPPIPELVQQGEEEEADGYDHVEWETVEARIPELVVEGGEEKVDGDEDEQWEDEASEYVDNLENEGLGCSGTTNPRFQLSM